LSVIIINHIAFFIIPLYVKPHLSEKQKPVIAYLKKTELCTWRTTVTSSGSLLSRAF